MSGRAGGSEAMLEDVDLRGISDPQARAVIARLLNLVEQLSAEVAALKAENQRLRDENARLKGEQGMPRVLALRPAKRDQASEQERRAAPKTWRKRAKRPDLPIDRTEVCRVDRATLPPEAHFKDYQEQVVQDLVVRAETVCFRRERWRLPDGRTLTAPLPAGYTGAFGPQLLASVLYLHYGANVTQPQLHTLLRSLDLRISRGYLAHLLTVQPALAAEALAIGQAGLATSPYTHLDVTPTRVKGAEQQCHVLGAADWVYYHTAPYKDRQAAITALQLGTPCRFQFSAHAWDFLARDALAADTRAVLAALDPALSWSRPEWTALLDARLPWLGDRVRQRVTDAAAVGYYHTQRLVSVVETLVCDDASAFKGITADLALCWVHEGRHYKKLEPVVPAHRTLLEAFRARFWTYYRELRAYQAAPTATEASRLATAFATLFATVTGYDALDARIAKTAAKHLALLRVLAKPFLPLTNNPAERGARRRVRKRDVSFGARSPDGIRAWDTFHTLIGTARLLGVNVWHYLYDRFSHAYHMPALADLIRQRAADADAALGSAA